MLETNSLWQLAGFALSTLGGTLLHFLYDWTGKSILVSPFSGVNESTWEHMKLLFWPVFVFALVQRLFFRDQKNYWCIKMAGMLMGLLSVPVLFYTYNGAFGQSPDWINISIFLHCRSPGVSDGTVGFKRKPAAVPASPAGVCHFMFDRHTVSSVHLCTTPDPTVSRSRYGKKLTVLPRHIKTNRLIRIIFEMILYFLV